MGNDLLDGGAGNDILKGGAGYDILILGGGNDQADGGSGNDIIKEVLGSNIIQGGSGRDTLDLRLAELEVTGVSNNLQLQLGYRVDMNNSNTQAEVNLQHLPTLAGDFDNILNNYFQNQDSIVNLLYKRTNSKTPVLQNISRNWQPSRSELKLKMDQTNPLEFSIFDVNQTVRDTLEPNMPYTIEHIIRNHGARLRRHLSFNPSHCELRRYLSLVNLIARQEYRDRSGLGYDQKISEAANVRSAYEAFQTSAQQNGRQIYFLGHVKVARDITSNNFFSPQIPHSDEEFITPQVNSQEISWAEEYLLGKLVTDGEFILLIANSGDKLYRFSIDTLRGEQNNADRTDNFLSITDFYLLTLDILNAQTTFTGIEDVSGSRGDDVIIGDGSANALFGQGGNDLIEAGDGDDLVAGGTGNDNLDGGDGNDVLFGGEPGQDTLDGGDDTDTVSFRRVQNGVVASIEGDGIDQYLNMENLEGSQFADHLTGDDSDNVLSGLDGDDTLDGDDGHDVLVGGLGADHLRGGGGIDAVSYSNDNRTSGVWVDLAVASQDSQDQPKNPGDLGQTKNTNEDTFERIENITGTNFDDTLKGNADSNTLNGLDGQDLLEGRDGNDVLIGGAGADTLKGGAGNDTVYYADGRSSGVTVDLQTGNNSDNDIFEEIESITGTDLADTLRGDAGNNELTGLKGDDLLEGGDGNDILRGSAGADTIKGGAGNDTASYVDSDEAIVANLQDGTVSDGDQLENIENLTGSQLPNKLYNNHKIKFY